MRDDLPAGTVTFLFTDVEGSTKLLHSLGAEGYADALAEHRRVIREACASEGGVEVDTQGDAFFFAFPTAPGALAAASTFADALRPSGSARASVKGHSRTHDSEVVASRTRDEWDRAHVKAASSSSVQPSAARVSSDDGKLLYSACAVNALTC